jgi:uncharacterized protein
MFFAAFTKGFAGFGQALVGVPLLAGIIGIQTTTPLMSLFAIIANTILVIHHREALHFGEVWRMSVASLICIPIGVYGLRALDERIVLGVLGGVLIAYSLYSLLAPRLPKVENENLAFLFGGMGGLLGGAYNTAGPPAVIYGTFRRWGPAEFKGNLQAFFVINSVLVVATHLASGNFTPTVLRYFVTAVPFLLGGLFVGSRMDRYMSPETFRKIILVLLIVLGLTLIF